MKLVKIALYSQNKTYGKRLFHYFEGKKNRYMKFYLATGQEGLMKILEEQIDGVLIDEDLQSEFPLLPNPVWLTNEEKEGDNKIFMYQSAGRIYTRIQEIFLKETVCNKQLMTCVFSPEGSKDKTEFALSICKERMEKGPVIYLSLSGFPVIFGENLVERPELSELGMSHLIFTMSERDFKEQLAQCSFFYEGIQVITPFWHYKDLLDIDFVDLQHFFELVAKTRPEASIVIEMGQIFEYTFEVLELADEILIPMSAGIFDQIRLNVLRGYCRLEGKETLAERFQIIIDEGEEYDMYEEI